jgi:hypothetical protein
MRQRSEVAPIVRTNYVLIDYENVPLQSLNHLARDHFKVFVFVGASQTKVPLDFAASLQPLGPRAEYVQISGNGRNALDFHIAYYIGQIAAEDAAASFHIVTKDSGFDPLIEHLKSKGVVARKVEAVTQIPRDGANIETARVAASIPKSPVERLQIILAKLQQPPFTKPGTRKALRNTIRTLFQKEQLTEEEIDAHVQLLENEGCLSISGTKVTYPLSGDR